ncbi:MAG TPA: DUF1326 domain-containing protein [Gemmataceae bacterium]|nr:DUF1326 domain-containing protein [Gemmataceae bacterium]
MSRSRIIAVLAVALLAAPFTPVELPGSDNGRLDPPSSTAQITGKYVEVRNCDVWTGPCFANAEGNLTGNNGAMVWHIEQGTLDGAKLDGLTVVAIVQASDTLGAKQYGAAKAVVIVDSKATEAQRKALIKLAQRQGGDLLANIAVVQTASIATDLCCCEGHGCASIDAGTFKIQTRCLDHHDTICGNEFAYYPPLTLGVDCVPAVAEHRYNGDGLASNWSEAERRGAYVGTFAVR